MNARRTIVAVLACAVPLLAAASASGADYPPPKNPGKVVKRPGGKTLTLKVSKRGGRGVYRTITAAVRAARTGDTIKVADGTYREGLMLEGRAKSRIRLIGNPRHPRRVVLEGKGIPRSKATAQNAVLVNGADGVTIDGFYGRNFRGNGFFVTHVNGYTMRHLVAQNDGTYGIFAFDSIGGSISDSTAYWHRDAGYYIGQTPRQTKPRRTFVKRIRSYENALGWSGTNQRYVTITDSSFYNNGTGITNTAEIGERFAPPEQNVIAHNRIFWNNLNYTVGKAPFKVGKVQNAGSPYPIGAGVLLIGSWDAQIENNQIFGNQLGGVGLVEGLLVVLQAGDRKVTPAQGLKQSGGDPDATNLRRNEVRGNSFGLGGRDLNGRDLLFDGNGSGNCFSGNALTSPIPQLPATAGQFPACPFTGANTFDSVAQGQAVSWTLSATSTDPSKNGRIAHPHAPQRGIRPIEHY